MSDFEGLPAQPHALRLLEAAVAAPAHAYLLSGPSGSGKRVYADRFAAALLRSPLHRIESRTHPDLFVLEPEGQGILIEGARRLRRDLHLRPFEADRRVYLILDAHLLRDESANALLKSLEEPPDYGVFVLLSDHAERMLPTIRSRVQTIDFRRYSAAALEAVTGDAVAARAALGSLDRATELATDPAAAERRLVYLELARGACSDQGFDPAQAGARVLEASGQRARAEADAVARARDARLESVDDPKDERALRKRYDERAKRESRRAEWDELRLAVDTVGLWYHDLLATALGADEAVLNPDTAEGCRAATARGGAGHAARALDTVADVRRSLEFNVHPGLAVEAHSSTASSRPANPPGRGCDGNRRRRRVPARWQGVLVRPGRPRAALGRAGHLPDVARARVRPGGADVPPSARRGADRLRSSGSCAGPARPTRSRSARTGWMPSAACCSSASRPCGTSLKLKPVAAELVFDQSRIVFSFSSDERPDTRALQTDLAGRLKRRVELRQVGPREQGRLCGEVGLCGTGRLCSARYPCHDQPITLKMAKEQDLPMNPGRITGLCGRLRCCLAFEHPVYRSFRDRAPAVGRTVATPNGRGIVRSYEVLKDACVVELDGRTMVEISLDQMVEVAG